MSLLDSLPQKLNQSRFLKYLYHMSKPVIDVVPFHIVQEGLSGTDGVNVKPAIDNCDVVFLKPSDMKVISASHEVPETEDTLLKRLSEGCICIGIKHYDEIAAYTWCNLKEIDSPVIRSELKADEAYLLDARTFTSYRGKNLAPYLRVELYKLLRQMGRTKFMSITLYLNIPAQRFKKKLNAKPQKLYLWIKFMKYNWAIPLKSYTY